MKLDDLSYDLPQDQIAQYPLAQRDASRLLILEKKNGTVRHGKFSEFPSLLSGNELLVFNNARVIPARLLGERLTKGGSEAGPQTRGSKPVEVFLTRNLSGDRWEALVRPGRILQIGERVVFGKRALEAEIIDRGERGPRTLQFRSMNNDPVAKLLQQLGHVPLPPYIRRSDSEADQERYQTVFAKKPGAVAAPTAGLHFTEEVLQAIRRRGCEMCELTLDVGLGTFQPIRGDSLSDHKMHAESYEIPEATVDKILRARQESRAIVAIGTTVVRALEAAALRASELRASEENYGALLCPGRGEAEIFITPGYEFKVTDALLTNFHLPKSTLLALVCAFAGYAEVMAAYRSAVSAGYRFYSYGDCMLIR